MPNKDIEKRRETWKKWYLKNKEESIVKKKRKARDLAYWSNKTPQKCSIEFCDNTAERHHENYDKPKEIIWICKFHHEILHSKKKCLLCEKKHCAKGLCFNHWRKEHRRKNKSSTPKT